MNDSLIKQLSGTEISLQEPTTLFSSNNHEVYWLGNLEKTAFRCNVYLIKDHDEAIIVDPGNNSFFNVVKERVAQIINPKNVIGQILCHQDPDVAASMTSWLDLNPKMKVLTSPRTQVLLPHYGKSDYDYYDVTKSHEFKFSSGNSITFVESPFLHFPGAFVTYDPIAYYLFSGDVWAALDMEWKLVVENFDEHVEKMDLFHTDYMSSNLAARGFVKRLEDLQLQIDAILPQHGSIMSKENVSKAMDYLKNIICGTDIIYADLK